jgi:uncharacterized membrane protein YhaH (DUF805 family)
MFKNPFSFNGRIRRLEYGLSYIIYVVAAFLVDLMFLGPMESDDSTIITVLLFFIPLLWFLLAQGAKRCHDRDSSGWFQLIPFYGLWMLFADGEPGINQYGPNPKGIGNVDEIDEIGNYLQ